MGAYTAAHANPQGAGDARLTALQIVRDEGVEGKLGGKVIVITGASSRIGLETARALSATGATLFLTARNLKTGGTALAGIVEIGRVTLEKWTTTLSLVYKPLLRLFSKNRTTKSTYLLTTQVLWEFRTSSLQRMAKRSTLLQITSVNFSSFNFSSLPCLLAQFLISTPE